MYLQVCEQFEQLLPVVALSGNWVIDESQIADSQGGLYDINY